VRALANTKRVKALDTTHTHSRLRQQPLNITKKARESKSNGGGNGARTCAGSRQTGSADGATLGGTDEIMAAAAEPGIKRQGALFTA